MSRRTLRADGQAMDAKGKYVYCIIGSPGERKTFDISGFMGSEVYALLYRDVSPVVSDVPFREYAVNEEEVEGHRRVVEEVMKDHSVLPVAYGMSFKNRKLLQIAMAAGYPAMQKAFSTVDGKVELGVKVFLPRSADWNDERKRCCRDDFLSNLQNAAADHKELKLFSDRLILNDAYLVKKNRIDEFSQLVSQLSSRYDDARVQYSGPWPAYNFVDIHILGKKRKGFR
ncbi:MAG: GvpL/GvpF family gas vesicle protein [Methanotrichaceae archaeon]|nr:GvpL/GvpF family gas vesicle protein [Methanotrichaceae archaeon]